MVVDVTTFRLADGVSADEFLGLDRRIQTELVPNRPGFLRRTTARRDGKWVVVTLWSTEGDARAFHADVAGHELLTAFQQFVAPGSVNSARYDTLD